MKLYNYFRSSASFRVRIALHLKDVAFEQVPVHLTRGGGEQYAPAFRGLNPQILVPVLEDEGHTITQSLAIVEYLEERFPQPPLLPQDPVERAWVRSIALSIACEIHPLNNLRVLRYLARDLGLDEPQRNAWYRHWVESGLGQVEARLAADRQSGRYAFGDRVSLADVFIVPQIFNARRFDCRLDHVPIITGIVDRCMELPAFADAQPDRQPDAE